MRHLRVMGRQVEDPENRGETAHWIAAPMKDVGTIQQFHEVVERADAVMEKLQNTIKYLQEKGK